VLARLAKRDEERQEMLLGRIAVKPADSFAYVDNNGVRRDFTGRVSGNRMEG
jgi:hypothetical protein